MEKLKIAIAQVGTDAKGKEIILRACEETALTELCTPIVLNSADAETNADALVLVPTSEPTKCPAGACEIIVTNTTNFMPLAQEPTAEDIIKFRDLLERDFNLRSPRIAIVQETDVQSPDLAEQVTTEQGIITYGPYTTERLVAEDAACHFDGIILVGDNTMMPRVLKELSLEAPVRFYASREAVVTAVYQPVPKEEPEDGLADISYLMHPFYTAIDIIRNRAFYDEARQNPLPKLFHDRREDRRKDNTPQASDDKEDKEQVS